MKRATLAFLPLLLFYIVLVIKFSSTTFEGDEGGYVAMARTLSLGNSAANSHRTLWWGPGYPLVLVPFVLLNAPLLVAKLLNAFFLFGSVLYLYKTLTLWLSENHAIIAGLVIGLYPPLWAQVFLLLTESLVILLVSGFVFHFCRSFRQQRSQRRHLLLASLFLAYLALTKVFFGNVILVGLLSFSIMFLWKRKQEFGRTATIYLLALVWCVPYLVYTHSVTNKVLYWGTSGGMSLYWMSTPYDNESGDWHSIEEVREDPRLAPHRAFFDRIAGLSEVQRDSEFTKQAAFNIIHYPMKYFVNWLANIGRLVFNYPHTLRPQSLTTYGYIIPDMFIVVLSIMGIYPTILRRNSIPYEIVALLYFCVITLGGTSLLSAYNRQFLPCVPIILLWLAFLYVRVLKIEVRPLSEII